MTERDLWRLAQTGVAGIFRAARRLGEMRHPRPGCDHAWVWDESGEWCATCGCVRAVRAKGLPGGER